MNEIETHEVVVSICGAVPDWCKCEWCGEVTKGKYADDGKPKRCSECGAFFDEYEEGGE